MIVQNNREGIIVVPVMSAAGVQVKSLTLLPGNNDVSPADWEGARKSLETHISRGTVKEIATEKKETKLPDGSGTKVTVKAKEFPELSAPEAEKIVQNTFNLVTLNKWKETESRESVRVAILNQIELIENHGKDKKKGTKAKDE